VFAHHLLMMVIYAYHKFTTYERQGCYMRSEEVILRMVHDPEDEFTIDLDYYIELCKKVIKK